jgi:hypothetical protein
MPAGRNTSSPPAVAARPGSRALRLFFTAQFFFAIFFQKIAVPVGALQIGVPFIAFYAGLACIVMFSRVEISLSKATAYAVFFMGAVVSQVFTDSSARFSTPSMLVLLTLYLPMIFIWRVPRAEYENLLKPFQDFMLFCAGVVLLQLLWQAVFGLGNQPDMELYVPGKYLLRGYNYSAPIAWGASFVRPNGFFMLEPSFIAMFLACALILEIMYYKRLWRMGVYAVALVGTFGATGTLMMIIAAPFLIRRPPMWMVLFSPVLLAVGIIGLLKTGILDRVGELSNPAASGWQRIVGPILQLGQALSDSHHIVTGGGAGSLSEVQSWPITKMSLEYGTLIGLAFIVFVTLSMTTTRNRPLFWAMLVVFNLTGGYLLSLTTVGIMTLLICLLSPMDPAERRSVRAPRMAQVTATAAPTSTAT